MGTLPSPPSPAPPPVPPVSPPPPPSGQAALSDCSPTPLYDVSIRDPCGAQPAAAAVVAAVAVAAAAPFTPSLTLTPL